MRQRDRCLTQVVEFEKESSNSFRCGGWRRLRALSGPKTLPRGKVLRKLRFRRCESARKSLYDDQNQVSSWIAFPVRGASRAGTSNLLVRSEFKDTPPIHGLLELQSAKDNLEFGVTPDLLEFEG
jgi:hypothetical protein